MHLNKRHLYLTLTTICPSNTMPVKYQNNREEWIVIGKPYAQIKSIRPVKSMFIRSSKRKNPSIVFEFTNQPPFILSFFRNILTMSYAMELLRQWDQYHPSYKRLNSLEFGFKEFFEPHELTTSLRQKVRSATLRECLEHFNESDKLVVAGKKVFDLHFFLSKDLPNFAQSCKAPELFWLYVFEQKIMVKQN